MLSDVRLFVKLNFDDYVKTDTSAVLGFIIRYSWGNHIVVATKNIGKLVVLIAEAMASSPRRYFLRPSIISTIKSLSKEIQKSLMIPAQQLNVLGI